MRTAWLAGAWMLAMAAGTALGQVGTAITYQGRVQAGAIPGTGAVDLRFRLMDAPSGGNQVGPTLCADEVVLADGFFTTVLDFGDQFSRGAALFMEIDVRQDPANGCGVSAGFTTLSPRQALTITPFSGLAARALGADNADSAAHASDASLFAGQSSSFYRNATNLNAGTIGDTRLSTNIPKLNAANTFTGVLTMSNPLNVLAGSGAGLTGLSAANVASGTLADARLSTNIPRLDAPNTWAGLNTFSAPGNVFVGDGAGLTNLSAANLAGTVPGQALGGTYFNAVSFTNTNNVITGQHSGNGSGLTGMNASNFTIGLLSPARGGTGTSVSAATVGDVLKWNGAAFTPQADANTTYTAGSGLTLTGTVFSINPGQITSGMLAAGAVTSAVLADGSVGTIDLATGAVGSGQLALDAASLLRVSGGAMSSTGSNIGIGIAPGTDRLAVNGAVNIAGTAVISGTSTLTGNVGIGGAPTSTKLNVVGNANVTGTVTATGFATPATAHTLLLSPADFVGDAKLVFDNSGIGATNLTLLTCGSTVSGTEGYAPVHLPDGSVITGMTAYMIDSSVLSNTSVTLLRRTPDNVDTGGTVASVASTGSDSAIRTFTDTTISGGAVNNNTSMYFVRVTFPLGASLYIDNPNLVCVKVSYTTTTP